MGKIEVAVELGGGPYLPGLDAPVIRGIILDEVGFLPVVEKEFDILKVLMSIASRRGMAVLISLVRLTSSSSTRENPTFLGVAGLRLMTDDTHDVGLALIIDGITHGLAVYGKTFIFLSIDFIPSRECPVQMDRIDTDEDITDDGLAGHNAVTILLPATEALPGLRL
jgi:hypothetical protein